MDTKNNKKEEKESGFDWVGQIEKIVESSLKGFMSGIAERIREKIKEIIANIQKNLLGFFMLAVGSIFALVGVSIFINDLIGASHGFGYAIVGAALLFLGLIIIKK